MSILTPEQQYGANLALVSPLGEIELETCRMRFEGYTSCEIEVGLTQRYGGRAPRDKTIRNWFARGGRLHDFYESYTVEEVKERQKIAGHMFSAHVKNATRTIVQIMLDSNQPAMARLRAAQYIINRELGLPPKTVSNETKDPVARILEEMGIIGQEPKI